VVVCAAILEGCLCSLSRGQKSEKVSARAYVAAETRVRLNRRSVRHDLEGSVIAILDISSPMQQGRRPAQSIEGPDPVAWLGTLHGVGKDIDGTRAHRHGGRVTR